MSHFEVASLFDLAEGLPLKPLANGETGGAKETSTVPAERSEAERENPSLPFPLAQKVKPHREGDDEALELAARLRRLLEPNVLARLKAMAPIEVRRWERVLDPEKCIRRTLEELETGRSWMLEAAKERTRRFLEAVEPLLKEKAPWRCGASVGGQNGKASGGRSYFTP